MMLMMIESKQQLGDDGTGIRVRACEAIGKVGKA